MHHSVREILIQYELYQQESHTYDKSRLIMTKPADGIGQRWEPVVNFFQEQSNNKWKEWKSSAHMVCK